MGVITIEELLDRLDRRELLQIAREGREAGVVRPIYPLTHYDANNLRRLLRRHADRLGRLASVQALLERYSRRSRSEPHTGPTSPLPPLHVLKEKLFPEVYGMDAEKEALIEAVYLPIALPKQALHYGVPPAPAILIEGAPGNGKSYLARRFARASGFYYRIIHTPALASKWYGETEGRLRSIFHKAFKNAPALLIFEEIDSLFPDREHNLEWLNGATLQFLLLMDEAKERGGVGIIGITNRAHRLDPALLRSERFDRRIYITPPDKEERYIILTRLAKSLPMAEGIDWNFWAETTAGFTRADLTRLVRQAGYFAFLRHYRERQPQVITEADLYRALKSE
ncbi:MAG: AAA family ATPase [Bacteroidia bacterium]|nr:AAA family ATPase [Bacteroidia bacterium]MCX7764488.1 AAA family ATPase [Bacteroidia bacterium]MDW8058335.1 AAA family ATPase [Bacteroidia bacterium]